MLDGLRDLRGNIQNTKPAFPISGFSAPEPTTILNFPEQTHGYVLSETAGTLIGINYSTEASAGTAATFPPNPASVGRCRMTARSSRLPRRSTARFMSRPAAPPTL